MLNNYTAVVFYFNILFNILYKGNFRFFLFLDFIKSSILTFTFRKCPCLEVTICIEKYNFTSYTAIDLLRYFPIYLQCDRMFIVQ